MKELEIIKNGIKELLENDASGHDYYHSLRVYKNAMKIADKEKCNKRMVALASLLHDVDDVKLFDSEDYENAKKIMQSAQVDEDTIEKVVEIIKTVSFRGRESIVPDTIEGKVVQDADRLDAIGAIGIARAFAYGGNKERCMYDPNVPICFDMDANEYIENEGTTINHFYEKLFKLKDMMNTETAKEIARNRDEFMREYIKRFLDEWEGI